MITFISNMGPKGIVIFDFLFCKKLFFYIVIYSIKINKMNQRRVQSAAPVTIGFSELKKMQDKITIYPKEKDEKLELY